MLDTNVRNRGMLAMVALMVLGLAPACGDGGGSLTVLNNRLQECDLLSDGRVPDTDDLTGDERCLPGCLADQSCADLEGLYCGQDDTLFAICIEQCGSYACDDGTILLDTWECDGFEDCAGGEDEVDCGVFVCDDGLEVPAAWECDGVADCEDASDEASCPEPDSFRCDDGALIPATWECDGEADCEDGSDEDGCASLTCPA